MAEIVERAQRSTVGIPPLSNKGGNITPLREGRSEISSNLDWLRYTVAWQTSATEQDNLRAALPRFAPFDLTGELLANGRGYNRAMALTIGVIHWHTERPEQGVSVELAGSALHMARQMGVSDLALLGAIADIGGKVSTMDAYLDLFNHGAQPHAILELRDAGTLKTSARQVGDFTSSTRKKGEWQRGETVYVGSPKSDHQIRIYNKAAEQGLDGDWIRLECRWRDVRARNAHTAMLTYGIAPTVRAALSAALDLPFDWWQKALTGEVAEIDPVGRIDGNTAEWLLKACLPALERELAKEHEAGTKRLMEAFTAVLDHYR